MQNLTAHLSLRLCRPSSAESRLPISEAPNRSPSGTLKGNHLASRQARGIESSLPRGLAAMIKKMSSSSRPPLIRAVGLFSLTAIAVNGTVGSGIFVLPAQVAKFLGPAGLAAYVMAALAMSLIVLCFAEVATLFDRSGGPYLYARAAFGDLVGFEIGWTPFVA